MRMLVTMWFLFAILMVPTTVWGQVGIEVGPRMGLDVKDIEEVFVGAEARFSVPRLPVQINPTLDYYLIEDRVNANAALVSTVLIQMGMNALYPIKLSNAAFSPYVGGGLSLSYISVSGVAITNESESDIGLNLIGGSTFIVGNFKPFAQVQITSGDAEFLTFGGGVLLSIRGD